MQIKDELIRNILFWIQQKRWLIIISVFGIIIYNLPYPTDISQEGYRTLILCFIVISLIITEPIPLPAVALLIAILEVLFHIAPATEVARTYMNDSVFFIMGSLMMAVAIIHQGLDKRLALGIIKLTGNKISNVILGFTCISAILSSFIGEHTVVALLLPVGLSLVKNCGKSYPIPNVTALILFSIAYGSTVGSIGTPSGGARNAIILEYWRTITESGITLTYLQWIIMAYPMVILGMLSTSFILQIAFKPEFNRLDTSIRRLKIQVAHQGKFTINELLTILIFIFVFLCWIFLNEQYGLGIIAIGGAFLYMATGIVEWKQISQNTNWGVILLFAGVISLGVQMKNTGAALWIGNTLINAFKKLDFSNLIKSCDIGLSTVILDLNFVKKHNLFFPKIKTKEDYILWLKIVKKIKVIQGLNKKLSYYRKSKNSLTSNIFLNLKNGFKVYKNYMKFSNFKSFFYLVVLSLNYIKKSYFQ